MKVTDTSLATHIDDLLETDPNPATLRRWFRRLDRIVETASCSTNAKADLFQPAYLARTQLMRAMSCRLPWHLVRLDRIGTFDSNSLDQDWITLLRKSLNARPPIVVLGKMYGASSDKLCLADGRHRVTAARANGNAVIRAVFA